MTESYTDNRPLTLRVVDIIEGTSVDGPGLRTSIYLAGCLHRCPGCHNPHTWDMTGGREMTLPELMDIVVRNDFNVTLTGGDPLYQLEGVTALAQAIRALGKTIWCYTGFTYEELMAERRYHTLIGLIDVLVDGPFIENRRDIGLRFRGSDNQRLIDCRCSTPDDIVLWNE